MAKAYGFGPETARKLLAIADKNTQPGTRVGVADRNSLSSNTIFRNDSAETVPAYGCMKVTGAELDPDTDNYVIVVGKPDGAGGPFLFNGIAEVDAGEWGVAHSGLIKAAFSTGTPAIGEAWGPDSDWVVILNGSPAITVYGGIESDVMLGNMISTDGTINIQAPDAGIPARVGTRLGHATCKVLSAVFTGVEIDLIDSGRTEEIYNTVTSIVLDGGEGIGQAAINKSTGKYQAIVGDCNDTTNEGGGPSGA